MSTDKEYNKLKNYLLYKFYFLDLERYKQKKANKHLVCHDKQLDSKINVLECNVSLINTKLNITDVETYTNQSETQVNSCCSVVNSTQQLFTKYDAIIIINNYNSKLDNYLLKVNITNYKLYYNGLIDDFKNFIWKLKDYIRQLFSSTLIKVSDLHYKTEINNVFYDIGSISSPKNNNDIIAAIDDIIENNKILLGIIKSL